MKPALSRHRRQHQADGHDSDGVEVGGARAGVEGKRADGEAIR
jgi:hypothetical protein